MSKFLVTVGTALSLDGSITVSEMFNLFKELEESDLFVRDRRRDEDDALKLAVELRVLDLDLDRLDLTEEGVKSMVGSVEAAEENELV